MARATWQPQLATLVSEVPIGDDWLFETKYDGYRAIAIVARGKVRILSRSGLDWTARFSAIADALARGRAKNAVFDGELCAIDDDGRTSFQRLQEALSSGDMARVAYFVFDLLEEGGDDLRGMPLTARKKRLAPLLPPRSALLKPSPFVRGEGARAFAAACEAGLEGVIAKRADAPYVGGRGRAWLKVKCEHRQELVIVGYTAPKGAREGLGALVLGVREGGALRVVGKVGTGFSQAMLVDLRRRLAPLARKEPPVGAPPRLRHVTWVEPRLVCEVRFTEWTRDGAIRHPAFLGLREDKAARDVTRERAQPAPRPSRSPSARRHHEEAEKEHAANGKGARPLTRHRTNGRHAAATNEERAR